MAINMPKIIIAQCSACSHQQEVVWGKYGSRTNCENCNIAPAFMKKIGK